ncbi:IS66 family transposase [Lactiplantibacillus plantarum]|uniref:IS66 family transposase n=1 Tax=Lactiplantibacillus plantarum TaxID=1590 RepID=UPI003427A47D
MGKAIDYATKQRPYLIQFLDDTEIALSNNIAKRHIKTTIMGHKNYLFSSSPKGAHTNTVMLSLVESTKANGLNSQRYIAYLLEEIPRLQPINAVDLRGYLPWTEQVQAKCRA